MPDRIRLLIVDDETRFLETLSKRLSIRGFDVTPVPDGEQAIRTARERPFDLAILDLRMPGMTGHQVLQALKAQQADLEVVILTGYGAPDSVCLCTQAGSHSYLHKPCEMEELLAALHDAYAKRLERRLTLDAGKVRK
jgi:two-component system NtrC family response regulator